MFYEISISFCRKTFKSAKSRHSEDSKLVRQVLILQKIIPLDMINYRKKLLVNFFSDQTLQSAFLRLASSTYIPRYEHRKSCILSKRRIVLMLLSLLDKACDQVISI